MAYTIPPGRQFDSHQERSVLYFVLFLKGVKITISSGEKNAGVWHGEIDHYIYSTGCGSTPSPVTPTRYRHLRQADDMKPLYTNHRQSKTNKKYESCEAHYSTVLNSTVDPFDFFLFFAIFPNW